MNLEALLLVALSLGLSNFAAAIGIGLGHLSTASRIKTGLAFGFFEALMPILGLLLGQSVAGRLGEIGRYAGAHSSSSPVSTPSGRLAATPGGTSRSAVKR